MKIIISNVYFSSGLILTVVMFFYMAVFLSNHKKFNSFHYDWFKKTFIVHQFTCQVFIGQFYRIKILRGREVELAGLHNQ